MDTDEGRLWLLLAILIISALLRAWYSACEKALTEVSDARVHAQASADAGMQRLDRLISAPTKLLRTFTVHRIFSGVWLGILTFYAFGDAVSAWFSFSWRTLAAALLLSAAATFLLTIFTDFLPKRFAAHSSERFAKLCAPSVQLLIWLMTPCAAFGFAVTKLFCKPFGISCTDEAEVVTEEEIRLLVDAGNETGGIEESQREMINNIFEFDDVSVSEVMTHRKDMVAVPDTAMASETAKLAMEEGFSRIPVYEKRVDTIVGVVLVKDMLPLVGIAEDCTVTKLMREAVFVPETAKCRDVFQKMRREKNQLAIVTDEYGGTAGMVTMEDLLEEIVGSIQDEFDAEEEAEITEIRADVYSIDGEADPEDIFPRLGVSPEEAGDFDTMSAYVVGLLGHIPSEGEQPVAEAQGVRYTLISCEDNWIRRIQAEVLPKKETEPQES